MSLSLRVQAPSWGPVAVLDEPPPPVRLTLTRPETPSRPPRFVLDCNAVIDEVRSRMDRRGIHWE